MYPSVKKRNTALKWSSYKFAKKLWIIILSIFIPAFLILDLCLPITPKEKLAIAVYILIFCIILGGMAFGIMSLVLKILKKGIEEYPVNTENRTPFESLFDEATKLNNETIWLVEPHKNEGWIDVTWKWKDSVDYSKNSIRKNEEIFYKLIKIYDDYTYEDLDMITSKNAMLSVYGGGYSKQFAIGHIQNKQYRITIGSDESGTGIHEYTIDTNELTNFMHKWLAEHGYAYRGL